MINYSKIKISPKSSIRETIASIDDGAMQIALVVTEAGKLIGTVTDGDIRRAILAGISLEETVDRIMNSQPVVCNQDEVMESVLFKMREKKLHHMPIVNADGQFIELRLLNELSTPEIRQNKVVLMAGGLGSRLGPLTEDRPKPMLLVGGRPILETILLNFIEHGFRNFYISVNYKSSAITDYFKDGKNWGININYLHESIKLGTAGALCLLPDDLEDPVLVMNGDLLSKINFSQLLDFHVHNKAEGTMCVREYDFQVPYGVINVNENLITSINEKPVQHFFVNAGIYVLEPGVLKRIPSETFYDMPTLFNSLVAEKKSVLAFPIREYWIDVGRIDDYNKANFEFERVFG